MIVQAIGLLDDLDKELNTYAMRVREWYGWHFPEMSRIVADNITYAKTVPPTPPISISQRTRPPKHFRIQKSTTGSCQNGSPHFNGFQQGDSAGHRGQGCLLT